MARQYLQQRNHHTKLLTAHYHCPNLLIYGLFYLLGAEGTIGSQKIFENISTEKRIISFIVLSLYILFLYFFYTKVTTFLNFIISNSQENILLINVIIILIAGISTVIGIIVIEGILVIAGAEFIVAIGGVIVATIGMNKKINYLYQIISIFLIWFFIIIWLRDIEETIQISFYITLLSIVPILTIKKIELGINLIIFGLSLLIFILHTTDTYNIYLGLFFIILPLTNSLLDYISLKTSQYMAKQILKDSSIIKALLHLLADFIVAIILLVLLALFLYFSIELFNNYTTENIPIKEMLMSAYHNPFSIKNGWITFMLLSTLVPTFVHLVIAMGALLTEIFPAQKSLEKLQAYTKGEEAMLESSAHYFTRILFLQVMFSFAIVGAIVYLIWYVV